MAVNCCKIKGKAEQNNVSSIIPFLTYSNNRGIEMAVNKLPQKNQSKQKCLNESCYRTAIARGYCSSCHAIALKTGKIHKKPHYKVCSVEGCNNPHNGHSFCNTHWKRLQKYGSLEAPKRERNLKKCAVEGCKNNQLGKKLYCSKHFQRIKKHGTLTLPVKNPAVNFWKKIIKGASSNDCWQWRGATTLDGYGQVSWKGKVCRAHRLSFFLHNGYWAKNHVLHSCDNPPCCNPKHLREGTDKDNSADKKLRGREPLGSKRSKNLTESDVFEIRRLSVDCSTDKMLAEKYGIDKSTVYFIRKRRTWKHI